MGTSAKKVDLSAFASADPQEERVMSNRIGFYFSPQVGAKVRVRWTPTYIKTDPAGLWCDPFYGCWQLADNDYSNQFETAVGITIRFE
jgi:hypothetical protein